MLGGAADLSEIVPRESITPDLVIPGDHSDVTLEEYDGIALDPIEIAFVNYYVGRAKFNAGEAYRLARGLENRDWNGTGAAYLRRPHVMKAINNRLEVVGASDLEVLAELKDVAFSEWRDHIDVKMRNGEVLSTRMDLSSKVRAMELLLKASGKLDPKPQTNVPVQVNINMPGMDEKDLA